MKWLIALLIMGFMTLLLLDLGLFERDRFSIATIAAALPFVGREIPFIGSMDADNASSDARLMLSTVTIIFVLYFVVRFLLEVLPPHWFAPDNGRVSRLPDPRLLRDRVRVQESNKRLKKLVHVTNGRWMFPLATILMFFLLVSMPVALLDRTYYWIWGLSLLLPITLYCCALNPDRPRKITMTTLELKEHLTPRSLPDDRSGHSPWDRLRAALRRLNRRLSSASSSRQRRRPTPERPETATTQREVGRATEETSVPDDATLDDDEPDAPPATAPDTGLHADGAVQARLKRFVARLRPRRKQRGTAVAESVGAADETT